MTEFFDLLVNCFFHTMGTYDDGSLFCRAQFLNRMDHDHSAFFQIFHNRFVVNDWSSIDRFLFFFCLFIYGIHRPLYAKTESCAFCHDQTFHTIPFSLQIFSIARTTSSIFSSDESRSTASSACFNGDISRCISR